MNLDTKIPQQRLRNILVNIGPRLVITSRTYLDHLLASDANLRLDQIVLIEDLAQGERSGGFDNLSGRFAQVLDTDPVCIINTSGSTGTPKGVVLNHRGTIDFMDWVFETFDFDSTNNIGSLSPFYFDIYTLEIFLCLAKGATLTIIPEQLPIFPAKLVEFLNKENINFIFWVPSIMVNIANLGLLEQVPLVSLRTVFFARRSFSDATPQHVA